MCIRDRYCNVFLGAKTLTTRERSAQGIDVPRSSITRRCKNVVAMRTLATCPPRSRALGTLSTLGAPNVDLFGVRNRFRDEKNVEIRFIRALPHRRHYLLVLEYNKKSGPDCWPMSGVGDISRLQRKELCCATRAKHGCTHTVARSSYTSRHSIGSFLVAVPGMH